MPVSALPEGWHSAKPDLFVSRRVDAISFYQRAFNATELLRLETPSGGIAHAEIKIGNSREMPADAHFDCLLSRALPTGS